MAGFILKLQTWREGNVWKFCLDTMTDLGYKHTKAALNLLVYTTKSSIYRLSHNSLSIQHETDILVSGKCMQRFHSNIHVCT